MLFKDYFSKQANIYSVNRPTYPRELFEYLASITPSKKIALDCATGNGQAAVSLAEFFESVKAIDASQKQLQNAKARPNVEYKLSTAEKTDFPNDYFDLITVAQALHWFDIEKFFNEAKRILKPNGIIAIFIYTNFISDSKIEHIIDNFYNNIVGKYWPPERKHVDTRYESIPFPFDMSNEFEEIRPPSFIIKTHWNCEQLFGYLESWSATQIYKEKNNLNPIDLIKDEVYKVWDPPEAEKELTWPLYLKIGIKK
ncbi:methyltransferase domain-containing protein [Melioribacteraceae bacterium 4301-Me]|uniref:class I SAM-dependent methyltransferase n=1 Tax=Pyranulibacter aquaticus TaxID=3163344 RepID=UPI00359A001A